MAEDVSTVDVNRVGFGPGTGMVTKGVVMGSRSIVFTTVAASSRSNTTCAGPWTA
jgi:hypothetical protein